MAFAPTGAAAPVLAVVNGIPTTTSTDVARHFGKLHRNVVRDIENLLAQLPSGALLNFEQGSYTLAETGSQQHKQYRLTRDGFTLLAMGFTGKKALQFKLAYIAAFNRMEAELAKPAHDPERQALAFALATEVATTVQRTVFDAVMAGHDDWQGSRYLFCLNHGHPRSMAEQTGPTTAWAKALGGDTLVTSFDQLSGKKPGVQSPLGSATHQQLAELAAACSQALSHRLALPNRKKP